jgi:hypothetical protein
VILPNDICPCGVNVISMPDLLQGKERNVVTQLRERGKEKTAPWKSIHWRPLLIRNRYVCTVQFERKWDKDLKIFISRISALGKDNTHFTIECKGTLPTYLNEAMNIEGYR